MDLLCSLVEVSGTLRKDTARLRRTMFYHLIMTNIRPFPITIPNSQIKKNEIITIFDALMEN